jgi:hypothetical protein
MESKTAWVLPVLCALLPGMASAQTARLPTLWVIGDSTANNVDHRGWGDPFASYFDAAKVAVVNRARAGRSRLPWVLLSRAREEADLSAVALLCRRGKRCRRLGIVARP